ncbi:CPBP family intramembrane glutamic endopeptidase [Sphingomicrobium sp. XHP0239]|uniref:CPBP family intramembrane glutamic endopeptidase n=1 Tax=Sphingomicrobium maritimum TaxID=3133972 RepID=UPI0031CC488F
MGDRTRSSSGATWATVLINQMAFAGAGWWWAGRQGLSLTQDLAPSVDAVAMGLAAAVGLYGAILLSRSLLPAVWRDLDALVRKIYAESGLPLTWPAILLLGTAAGIGEEILFRGALQGWLAQDWPIIAAVALPSVLFALLHPYSLAYVAYAFVIGCLLGLLYVVTGSLLAVVIAHGFYDVLALAKLKRVVEEDAEASA